MKLKLNTILAPAFQAAFIAWTEQPQPAVDAYRLGKILKVLQTEAQEFEVHRGNSVKAHSSDPADPSTLNADEFRKDIEKLLETEVEIPLTEKFVLSNKVSLSAQQLVILDDFIDPRTGGPVAS